MNRVVDRNGRQMARYEIIALIAGGVVRHGMSRSLAMWMCKKPRGTAAAGIKRKKRMGTGTINL